MTNILRVAACAGVLASGVGAASADVAWSQPSGTAAFFTWANGHNTNTNLFGSPTLVGGTTFQFFPTSFTATSSNGGTGSASDTLSVDLTALPGYQLDSIQINEGGSYALSGNQGGSVSATGAASLTDLNTPRTFNANTSGNPTFPVFGGSGSWTAGALIDLAALNGGIPVTSAHLEFTNNLVAISVPGSTATITKTFVGLPVAITIIPAPGAAGILALGGLALVRRRRR
jgi:uncharacterized protein (TIGR03382 family)